MGLAVVTIVFLVLYGGLFAFYFIHWKRLTNYTPTTATPTVFVSILIAARNEETTLPLLLSDLRSQSYPINLFEVIVVNDYSTDGTAALAAGFNGEHFRMLLPDVPPEASSKKLAIATAIKNAKGELLLITDADCRVQPDWLSTFACFYQEKKSAFIAAPVCFTTNNSLLQILQALDFLTLQGITAAGVSAGVHTMCNGANLAYTKSAFEQVNGFAGIDHVATGDDMLLMHKIWKAQPKGVHYLKSKAAVVSTTPAASWASFIVQRRRWASKTLVYDDYRLIVVLAFVLLFNLLFFALLAASFFNTAYWLWLLVYLLGKTVAELPFVAAVATFYDQQRLLRWFALLQPVHIVYTIIVGLISQVGKYEWKGRRTR